MPCEDWSCVEQREAEPEGKGEVRSLISLGLRSHLVTYRAGPDQDAAEEGAGGLRSLPGQDRYHGENLLQFSHLREAGLHQGLRIQAFTTTKPMAGLI